MTTLEWGDTFDHYGSIGDPAVGQLGTFSTSPVAKKWTSLSGTDSNAIGVGTLYARPGAAGGCGIRIADRSINKNLPGGATATRCVGFWVFINAINNYTLAVFYDQVAGGEQCSVRMTSGNKIIASRNGTTLATSTNSVSLNTWYWIEFKATIDNSTGVYEVRVNGTSTNWIPQATGANTRGTGSNNSADSIRISQQGSGQSMFWDDVVVADDFMGQVQGVFLRPIGPGNYAQWTPNAGTNDGVVRNTAPDDDQTFNASTTSGNIDTFAMEKLPGSGSPTILGIQHVLYAKQDAGVQRTLRPKQRTSSTNYNGTSVNTGASYVYITEVKATDPSTSSAWTKSGLESAEFGYENV